MLLTVSHIFRNFIFLSVCDSAHGLDNGVGLHPPMGYNSWNHLKCGRMNETNIRAVVDAMVSNGLSAVGYEYVNLDDCWVAKDREPKTGRLQGNPDKFPSGMKALGDYIHSKGLKFGIYTDRGTKTCAGVGPGSEGHEQLDAQTFAEWGVDYVKEDNCYNGGIPGVYQDKDKLFKQFGLFRDALNATGRPIFFSVCGGGWEIPVVDDLSFYATDPRGGRALGNSWRVAADCSGLESCEASMHVAANLGKHAGPGGFNDPDMLLGSATNSAVYLSKTQSRTQFNIWAVLMAPLLLGMPVDEMNEWDRTTYLNAEVIAVNQDALLRQGRLVHQEGSLFGSNEIWARELSGGALAVVFKNTHSAAKMISCDTSCWKNLPFTNGTQLDVRDLWAHRPAAVPSAIAGEDYTVTVNGGGDSMMFKLTPKDATVSSIIV